METTKLCRPHCIILVLCWILYFQAAAADTVKYSIRGNAVLNPESSMFRSVCTLPDPHLTSDVANDAVGQHIFLTVDTAGFLMLVATTECILSLSVLHKKTRLLVDNSQLKSQNLMLQGGHFFLKGWRVDFWENGCLEYGYISVFCSSP